MPALFRSLRRFLVLLVWMMFWPISHLIYKPKDIGLDLSRFPGSWPSLVIGVAVLVVLSIVLSMVLGAALRNLTMPSLQ